MSLPALLPSTRTTCQLCKLLALFLISQISLGLVQRGFKDPHHPSRQDPSLPTLALKETIKIVLSVALLWKTKRRKTNNNSPPLTGWKDDDNILLLRNSRPNLSDGFDSVVEGALDSESSSRRIFQHHDQEEEHDLPSWSVCDEGSEAQFIWPPRQQVYQVLILAVLYAMHQSVDGSLILFVDARTIRIIRLLLIFFTAGQMRIAFGKCIPSNYWTSAFLQVAAVLLQELFTAFKSYSRATYALLIFSTWLTSIVSIATSNLYQSNQKVSMHQINIILFTSILCIHLVNMLLHLLWESPIGANSIGAPSSNIPTPTRNVIASAVIILLRAIVDIISIAILRYTSPFVYCAGNLLSTALIPPISYIIWSATDGFNGVKWVATVLAIYAACSYLINNTAAVPNSPSASQSTNLRPSGNTVSSGCSITKRPLAIAFLLFVGFPLAFVFMTSPLPPRKASKQFLWNNSSDLAKAPLAPHKLLPPQSLGEECVRRPLPPSSAYVGPGPRPDFHAFDDVLLVAFFSHPRYDVNLDGYREAYSAYFPNILFIGPASREDAGFLHSYDVVLDSFQSEEDFSEWYKLAGSMAHHMLYTAVKDYPCYSGYLWAPFDAFLNVPRLAQFPQDKIWYHSPFGEYIPNRASSTDPNLHSDPAHISDKSIGEYLEENIVWGAKWTQWWWGEPHVGLEVCMAAYNKLPQRMRDRLSGLTGSPERFVGGCVDTAYIPGSLRDELLDTLATFLETDCFLEIVLPTTLHLILPEDTKIAYTDHWRTNDPPFDTTFIREKWAEGYEVDSFHTFHWGDPHDDGLWRANENSLEDVREVLRDSFQRQNMTMPSTQAKP